MKAIDSVLLIVPGAVGIHDFLNYGGVLWPRYLITHYSSHLVPCCATLTVLKSLHFGAFNAN